MHNGSMDGWRGMWPGMGIWWILILVLVVLGSAALARNVFGGRG